MILQTKSYCDNGYFLTAHRENFNAKNIFVLFLAIKKIAFAKKLAMRDTIPNSLAISI